MENTITEIQAILEARKLELIEKIERLDKNKRRGGESLSADSSEQAIEIQNDEVIDTIDKIEVNELANVEKALLAISSGTYGSCIDCGESITSARLKALPLAVLCLDCASEV